MEPFIFMTSVDAIQLTGRKAASLAELYQGLQEVDGSCIYQHTHRFYRTYSFLGSSYRSDFAHWVGDNLKEAAVAERMGSLDLRDYGTIRELKEAILQTMEPLREIPERWNRPVPPGLEFHFCRSTSLVMPAGYEAHQLEEFLDALERIDISSVYYHLIEAPLHYFGPERGFSNDFSIWLDESLKMPDQAKSVAEIDPYAADLETVRKQLLGIFGRNRIKATVHRIIDRLERKASGEASALWLKHWRREK